MPATGSIQRLAKRYVIALFLFFHRYLFQHPCGDVVTRPGKRGAKASNRPHAVVINTSQIF